MANDIAKSITSNDIKNGTIVVSCTFTGEYSTIDTYVNNNPTITDIQDKYDTRFDDVGYYCLGNETLVGG